MRSLRPHLCVSHISRYSRIQRFNKSRPPNLLHLRICSAYTPTNQAATLPPQASSTAHLYKTSPYSPGSPLFTPDGSYIFNRLISFLRAQYPTYGFSEVVSPTIYKKSLWETSGHWENYAADMYAVTGRCGSSTTPTTSSDSEEEEFGLKPMNCPGHCVLFSNQTWSYKDLPVRFADFSPLHRNENSGSLSGLTRVRRFHQDDGHIFCTPTQIKEEIQKQLEFVSMVYSTFGLPQISLVLSTRPTDGSAIGSAEDWAAAESHLEAALNASGQAWTLNEGDGAFYGPKIDIRIQDPSNENKQLQTATIQLDFQLPERFDLTYRNEEGDFVRPVMIHRAIYGSLERFMHILLTQHKGVVPFWLSPRPAIVLTLNDKPELLEYAEKVRKTLSGHEDQHPQPLDTVRLPIAVDSRPIGLAKKVLEAREKGFQLGFILGQKEMEAGLVSLRSLRVSPTREEETLETLEAEGMRCDKNGELRIEKMRPEAARRLFMALVSRYL